PADVLTPVAKAELYTARNSPVVVLDDLQAVIAEAPELPQADQLARMAQTRGAIEPLMVVPENRIVSLGSAPIRYRARPVQGEPAADDLRAALEPLIKVDDAAGSEALLIAAAPILSAEARAEAGQRVAWAYYVLGQDAEARRVAETWRAGATGEWVGQSAWISALASWRQSDCEAASRAFREVAATSQQRELAAGGYYWAARSEQMCRRPRAVAPLLKAAAQNPESFYGLLARETLGMDTRLQANSRPSAVSVAAVPNVRRAIALATIGERGLAEQLLRHQARICRPSEHQALIEVAKQLELSGAQFWLATNGQPGAAAGIADRYPNPRWTPLTGWRIDPALAYGHIIQESTFRTEAMSPAGAIGLMQVRPGTAGDMARARGLPFSTNALTDPRSNLEYGQSFIETMRRNAATGGQLPKVIASYNAGPVPISRWAYINDKGDPLLWIESLPYWETRYYVPAVLRNMWVYQGLNHSDTPALKAMAEHRWPAFPTGMTRLTH
ncbi:MAG: lytic transglycosylase domain-containing protein, partial [Sphingomicrobium sp.]